MSKSVATVAGLVASMGLASVCRAQCPPAPITLQIDTTSTLRVFIPESCPVTCLFEDVDTWASFSRLSLGGALCSDRVPLRDYFGCEYANITFAGTAAPEICAATVGFNNGDDESICPGRTAPNGLECVPQSTACCPIAGLVSLLFEQSNCIRSYRSVSLGPAPFYEDYLYLTSTGGRTAFEVPNTPACGVVFEASFVGSIRPAANTLIMPGVGLLRSAIVLPGDESPVGAMFGEFGRVVIGPAVYDPADDSYNFNFSFGLIPSAGPRMHTVAFTDRDLDVDLDGRFTAIDVVLGAALLGGPPGAAELVDFDRDGVVEIEDLQDLQRLVDAGFASGVVGDVNGDTVFDCADDLSTITTAVIGGVGYQIVADLNLDGAVTQSEIDALPCVRALNNPANDLDSDGDVDLDDAQAIAVFVTTSMGTGADVNCDENIDLVDAQFLAASFVNGCL